MAIKPDRNVPSVIRLNLLDKKFGQLTVVGFAGRKGTVIRWLCRCSCGRFYEVSRGHLRNGHTTRCITCVEEACRSHGRSGDSIYNTWVSMKCQRLLCKKWMKFEPFLADLGERPKGAWIQRRNLRKPHSPSNSYWETPEKRLEREVELILAAMSPLEDEEDTRQWLRDVTRQRRHQLTKRARAGQKIRVRRRPKGDSQSATPDHRVAPKKRQPPA